MLLGRHLTIALRLTYGIVPGEQYLPNTNVLLERDNYGIIKPLGLI